MLKITITLIKIYRFYFSNTSKLAAPAWSIAPNTLANVQLNSNKLIVMD